MKPPQYVIDAVRTGGPQSSHWVGFIAGWQACSKRWAPKPRLTPADITLLQVELIRPFSKKRGEEAVVSDLTLRQGLRALRSGGLATLGDEELDQLSAAIALEENDRLVKALPPMLDITSTAKRFSPGAGAKLWWALKAHYKKPAPTSEDLVRTVPAALLRLNGIGDETILAAMLAILCLTGRVPKGWRTIPIWSLRDRWAGWLSAPRKEVVAALRDKQMTHWNRDRWLRANAPEPAA